MDYYGLIQCLFHTRVIDSGDCPIAKQQHSLSGVGVVDNFLKTERSKVVIECFRIHPRNAGGDDSGCRSDRSRSRGCNGGGCRGFSCNGCCSRNCCRCCDRRCGRLRHRMCDRGNCLWRPRSAARKGKAQECATGKGCEDFQINSPRSFKQNRCPVQAPVSSRFRRKRHSQVVIGPLDTSQGSYLASNALMARLLKVSGGINVDAVLAGNRADL